MKNSESKPTLEISASIQAPIKKVWDYFNLPKHVVNWNAAADSWHCPSADNDLKVGGKFNYTMAAKDGSFQFDFSGTYTEIEHHSSIKYVLDDDRKVEIQFRDDNGTVNIIERFEAENMNPLEMQQGGWQAILDNFKQYTENN